MYLRDEKETGKIETLEDLKKYLEEKAFEYYKNPNQVEEQLLKILPNKFLKKAHHLILLHGRYICKSRNPLCVKCVINKICLY
jgi:endonuclease III